MTFKELKNKLSNEEHITSPYRDIVYGKKSDSPSILGIYEENGVWYIYGTDDRGNIMVYDQGEEEKMVDTMYQEIINNEKFYLKKHDIVK